QEVGELLGRVRPMAGAAARAGAAERLTALVEGLSSRWLSGSLPLAHARELTTTAIAAELRYLAQPDG
ncbi:TetR family transcriptional regulator, partial [Streptomyces sp. NPDC056387]